MGHSEGERPQGPEDLVHVAEVGIGFLDRASKLAETSDGGPANIEHDRLDRIAAESRAPCDAPPCEVAIERFAEPAPRRLDGERRPPVRTRHRGEEQRRVGHVPGDGAGDTKRVVEHFAGPRRNPSRRGTKTHHVGPRRGVAKRAAHIRAVREREHPARDRDRGAPAAASAGVPGRVGVPGGSEHLIEGLRAGSELRGIGLADDDRAGCLETLDVELVLLGNEVAIDRRSERGADPTGQGEVLARDGQPVERPWRLSSGKGGVRRPCAFEGGLGKQGDDGVDRGVHRLDSGEEPGS